MRAGKSVRLFLAEGSMGGLVTAEIMNWTGHILAVGRSGLRELLKRPEATRTGVYILIGEDADSLGAGRSTSARVTMSPHASKTSRARRTSGTA